MKWFKHDSDAGNDAKLRKLRSKYGASGYGIFWYCLELIARNVDKNNLTFELEHDAELIADDFKLSRELVQEMMSYMVGLGLFENRDGIITCLKMSNRADEYTHKLIKDINTSPDTHPIKIDVLDTKSLLIEEKRKEKNIKTSIPKNFFISERVTIWAMKNKYKNLEKHLEKFILSCESMNYKYVNWDSAFMKAITDNWAKIPMELIGVDAPLPEWMSKTKFATRPDNGN